MRHCKCGTEMEHVGGYREGSYWCPYCGRHSQSYVCAPMQWREPKILKELTSIADTVAATNEVFGEDTYAEEHTGIKE